MLVGPKQSTASLPALDCEQTAVYDMNTCFHMKRLFSWNYQVQHQILVDKMIVILRQILCTRGNTLTYWRIAYHMLRIMYWVWWLPALEPQKSDLTLVLLYRYYEAAAEWSRRRKHWHEYCEGYCKSPRLTILAARDAVVVNCNNTTKQGPRPRRGRLLQAP